MSSEAPPTDVLDFYVHVVDRLRAGDLESLRALAPGVAIQTEGWPYEDETGPLNPHAFVGEQPLMFWEQLAPDRYVLQSAIAVFTIERRGDHVYVADAYMKPIE